MPSFQIVMVPADSDQPIEERTITWSTDMEKVSCITDSLQAHFKKTTAEMSEEQKSTFLNTVIQQAKKNNPQLNTKDIDPALLANFGGTQMVDIVSLLVPTKANGFHSVSLYVDDGGSFKQSPENTRASVLCTFSGKPTRVLGDAFIARATDDGNDLFERLDFFAKDFAPSAPWIQEAKAFYAGKANQPAATKEDLLKPKKAAAAKKAARPIDSAKAKAWFQKLKAWADGKLTQWDDDEAFRADRQKKFASRDLYKKDLYDKLGKNFEKQTGHKAADYLNVE